MSDKSPRWAVLMYGQLAEMKALDIPYMLDKLEEMQKFINYTRATLEDMQRREAVLERTLHLEEQP